MKRLRANAAAGLIFRLLAFGVTPIVVSPWIGDDGAFRTQPADAERLGLLNVL